MGNFASEEDAEGNIFVDRGQAMTDVSSLFIESNLILNGYISNVHYVDSDTLLIFHCLVKTPLFSLRLLRIYAVCADWMPYG